jgi:hypothetical protein
VPQLGLIQTAEGKASGAGSERADGGHALHSRPSMNSSQTVMLMRAGFWLRISAPTPTPITAQREAVALVLRTRRM